MPKMTGVFLPLAAGVVLVPALLFLVAVTGLLPSKATDSPPAWEAALGGRALDASLERRAAGLANPFRPEDEAALTAGMALYRFNCAGCHGGARDISEWGTKGFYPRIPQFAHQQVDVTPEEAYVAIRDGIRYSGMGAWQGMLSDKEMWQLANFVSSVRRLPPAVDYRWHHPPRPAPAPAK